MTKYKIVGIIDLILGILQLLFSIVIPLSVFSTLRQLYYAINTHYQMNLMNVYVIVTLILLMAALNLFLGAKGLTGSKEKERYFKYGIISAVATLFLTGILGSILISSIISPIYNLGSFVNKERNCSSYRSLIF